jgi:diguanylate cyclase (GGDEF)-like protein/PAS domain S-box-containing protein
MTIWNTSNDELDDPPSKRQVEDLLLSHRKALAALMHSEQLRRGDVAGALRLVTEVAAQLLRVERASVWHFSQDRSSLQCHDLFERSVKRHSRGQDLPAAHHPGYFAALDEERSIAAIDAQLDPRTREFSEAYLVPNGIGAMLDAPIFVRGRMLGVVCHEHVGGARHWQPWEELVAASIADFVALALESAERNVAEQRLEQLVTARTAELTRTNEDLQREIGARQQIEARLRHSEENMRMLFEVLPVVVVLTRLSDQRVLLTNPRANDLFEISGSDVVGVYAPDYWVNPADRERLRERLKKEGRVDNFEAELKTKGGRRFPALVSGQLLTFEGEPALLVSAVDVTEQKTVEARLRELATTDTLTGWPNRRHFLDMAANDFARAERYGRSISLAMIDIDHFKDVNDRHGHDAGDAVLRAIGDTFRRTLRKSDLPGRLGGEEFGIVFIETSAGEAAAVTERLARAVAETVVQHDGAPISVTISAGVVERRPAETLESALKRADDALYVAKNEGRNRVVVGK